MRIYMRKTLGVRVKEISNTLAIPQGTVDRVIREYQESLKQSLQEGESICIEDIMYIKVEEKQGKPILRSRVSPVVKRVVGCSTYYEKVGTERLGE